MADMTAKKHVPADDGETTLCGQPIPDDVSPEEETKAAIGEGESELPDDFKRTFEMDGIQFDALGNIPTSEPPYWRSPSSDPEIVAWQKLFRPGSQPFNQVKSNIDKLVGAALGDGTWAERSETVDEFMEIMQNSTAKNPYPELHHDGQGHFDWCNVAEMHALKYPGHSLTVVMDFNPTRALDASDPSGSILRIVCHGTPDEYLNGTPDCDFDAELEIYAKYQET